MGNRVSNLPGLRTFRMAVTTAGSPEKLGVKLRGTGIAFNNNSGSNAADTITDTGSGFLKAGFIAGDTITISGATNSGNNATFTIKSIVAGTITLTESGVLTTEAAGATVVIKAFLTLPDGVSVTIKARHNNTNDIYVGHGSEVADQDDESGALYGGFRLDANESIEVQVSNTDLIWLDADTSGEGVEAILETNLQGS